MKDAHYCSQYRCIHCKNPDHYHIATHKSQTHGLEWPHTGWLTHAEVICFNLISFCVLTDILARYKNLWALIDWGHGKYKTTPHNALIGLPSIISSQLMLFRLKSHIRMWVLAWITGCIVWTGAGAGRGSWIVTHLCTDWCSYPGWPSLTQSSHICGNKHKTWFKHDPEWHVLTPRGWTAVVPRGWILMASHDETLDLSVLLCTQMPAKLTFPPSELQNMMFKDCAKQQHGGIVTVNMLPH